jgi:hypothetical protein
VDSRVSLYSLWGDVFGMVVAGAAAAMAAYLIFGCLKKKGTRQQ